MRNTIVARPGGGLHSVSRAFALLERIAAAPGGHGVSDLARELGVHKSTASRLLSTMRGASMVEVDEDSGHFTLGPGLLRLAARASERLDLGRLSVAILRELASRSGETAYLSVRRGRFRVAIQEIESANPVRMVAGVGHPYPLYAGAPSKALLVGMAARDVAAVLRDLPRRGRPRETVARVLAELERVRADGYAVSFGENAPRAASIAVPVRDHTGAVVAALGIAGVSPRWARAQMLEHLPALRRGAAEIGELLGRTAGTARSALERLDQAEARR
jgi:DNA-binding IclR family transcriptional regulator